MDNKLALRQIHDDIQQTNALLTELLVLLQGDGDRLAIIQTVNADDETGTVTKE